MNVFIDSLLITLFPSIGICLAIAVYLNKGGRKKWNLKKNVIIKSLLYGILLSSIISTLRYLNFRDLSLQNIDKTTINKKRTFASNDSEFKVLILSFFNPDDSQRSTCVGESIYIHLTSDQTSF